MYLKENTLVYRKGDPSTVYNFLLNLLFIFRIFILFSVEELFLNLRIKLLKLKEV